MPGHLANDRRLSGAPTAIEGLDLALAGRNVHRGHGDPGRFFEALAAGQHVDPALDRERALGLAAVAAWRAGVLALRDEALARIDALHPDDALGRRSVSAALGLDAGGLGAFVEHQRADRFWWPGRVAARGYVCAVGGFTGLGGAWLVPPSEGWALREPGAFGIRTGDEWWRLDADVWGSRLTRLDEAPGPASADRASLVWQPSSYLAWVHVREAA